MPYWLATTPVCTPAGTDVTQVRHGEMTTVAAALAVRYRVAPPGLAAEADAVRTAAAAAAAATTAIPLPACRLAALPSAPTFMIAHLLSRSRPMPTATMSPLARLSLPGPTAANPAALCASQTRSSGKASVKWGATEAHYCPPLANGATPQSES